MNVLKILDALQTAHSIFSYHKKRSALNAFKTENEVADLLLLQWEAVL